jgi:uncharacterized membrane protein
VRSHHDRSGGRRYDAAVKHVARPVSLFVVLAAVTVTMALGMAQKTPCAGGNYEAGRQYKLLCYSDIVPLLGTEQLQHGRLPFFDECATTQSNCDEYPVLTMYLMRVAAWISGDAYMRFYYTNSVLLLGFALVTAACLWLLAGNRALWFALAPSLLVYGTINWDLAAVALATAALVAWAKRRDGWAGVLIGLGAATKFYPAIVLIPLFLQGLQDREPDRSVRVLWWSAGTWVVVNAPFALAAPGSWWEFFRFNGARTPDFDSIYYIACRHVDALCVSISNANLIGLTAFVLGSFITIMWKVRRDPDFPRWSVGVPLLIWFLISNKVYSPQYSLWLLPWFALTMPRLRRFIAFEVADVAVFVTRFWFFGTYIGTLQWVSQTWFEIAIGVRFAVLLWCLVGWVRDEIPARGLSHVATARAPAAEAPAIPA